MNSMNEVVLTDIGHLAKDWEIKTLEQISSLMTNGFVGTATSHYVDEQNGILYIQGYNVEQNSFNLNGIKYVSKEFNAKHLKSQLKEGDLLTIQTGDVGLTTFVSKELEGSNCHALIITRLKSHLCDYKFISHYLNSHTARLKLLEIGSTMKHLNVGDLLEFKVPTPQLPEQHKIAQALTDADNYISALEKLIEKKKMIKEGLMVNLLTGKQRLKEFAFNEDGTAKSYKDSELGKIPEDWEVIELIDTASKSKKWSFVGGPFGSSLKTDDYTEYGIQIIQLQNMGDGHFINDNVIYTSVEKANELLSNNIYAGEIIISKMGDPVARACIMPNHADRYLMASDGIRLSIDTNKFDTRFIHDFINFKIFRKQAINASTGSTRQRISLSELKKLKLFSPSYEEQLAIGNTFKDLDSQILALDQKLNKAKLLKQGMMQKLLTGEIRLA